MRRTLSILLSNPLSVIGLILVGTVVFSAVFADLIAPFPSHRGAVVDFTNFNQPPHWPNIFGTDLVGRDVFRASSMPTAFRCFSASSCWRSPFRSA